VARIRSIKPDFWKSEKVARMTGVDGRQARLLFIALWNFCEDSGCMRAAPAYVRAEVFPYDEDITAQDVARWLDLLEATRLITRYQRPSGSFLVVRGFKDHQKIEKPSKPQLPLPTEEELAREGSASHPSSPPPLTGLLPESSPGPHRLLADSSQWDGKGGDGNGEDQNLVAADAAEGPDQRPLPATPEPARATSGPTPEELQAVWNRVAEEKKAPRWQSLNDKRRKAAKERLREEPGLAAWEAFIRARLDDPFFKTDSGAWKPWVGPDWLLRADRAAQVTDAASSSLPKSTSTRPLHPEEQKELERIRAQRRAAAGAQPQ
jgi:hypothetical protein